MAAAVGDITCFERADGDPPTADASSPSITSTKFSASHLFLTPRGFFHGVGCARGAKTRPRLSSNYAILIISGNRPYGWNSFFVLTIRACLGCSETRLLAF